MKRLLLILTLAVFTLITSCNQNDPLENTIVLVKYKAQSNKSIDAITGLKALMAEVEKEDHFVSIRLHVDPNDNSNILLYEEWEDELYYRNQHMKTDHLQKFQLESQSFLEGPPEITYWRINEIYN